MSLNVITSINDPKRITSVDCFRGIAILFVVAYHFNNHLFPAAMIGVDLFFVISGLLIGGLLTRNFDQHSPINFFKFFLQRGFKIWPSYYFFLIAGTCVAYLFYRNTHLDYIIPLWDFKRYLFFYQNYTGLPLHWDFDQVWSLCVEEHFYIMLPLLFIFIQRFVSANQQRTTLYGFVIATILIGIIFKFCSLYLTHSKDTYAGTHNRIDALAWGVLLNLIIRYNGHMLKSAAVKGISIFLGIIILIVAVYIYQNFRNEIFNKVVFHSVIPFSFFLMMMGTYFIDFSKLKVLRVIAYYSYNWYLWHPVFAPYIKALLGETIIGFAAYFITTLIIAVITTIIIEEPSLKWRHRVIKRIFKQQSSGGLVEIV